MPPWSATCLDWPPTVGPLPITSAPVTAARTSSWALSAHSGLPGVFPQRWPSGLSHVHGRGLPRGSDSPALQHFPVPLGHPVLAAPASATQAANQGSSPRAGAVPGPAGPMSLLLSIAPRPCSAGTPPTSHLDPDRLPCFRLSSLNPPTDVKGTSLSTAWLTASVSKIRS